MKSIDSPWTLGDHLSREQARSGSVDIREQLYNGRQCGPVALVQLPLERITTLHGIMTDLDPDLLRPGNPWFPPADDPRAFHDAIRPVLDRHQIARHSEVRASGRGLHLITWLDPPVELRTAGEQVYWAGVVDVLRATLPSDPCAPGITALTRPVGSVNGKNGRTVEILRAGVLVPPADVEDFARRVQAAPFRELTRILFGSTRLSPCPMCGAANSTLSALDRIGKCYKCGKVRREQIYDVFLRPDSGTAGAGLQMSA